MKKVSLLARCTIVIMLVAVVLASFPTANVLAKGNNQNLEDKWDQLVTNYSRQSTHHNSVHKWIDHWFMTQKKTSLSDKNEIRKHLSICNSAIASAGSIVAIHAGFDASGNVIDRGAARKSIKDLAYYLRQHAGSVKNLIEHLD
jgi:hypothetical protein